MALGFSATAPTAFLPILKYHIPDGRFLRIDRTPVGTTIHDITDDFAAVVDMDAIEVGWMRFGHGVRPDMRLFPLGGVWPEAPSVQHKRGLRVVLQLSDAHGGEVRELSSTAGSFLEAFDALHDEFLAGRSANPGKLPVVVLMGRDADNRPHFTIAGWVERPPALAGSH
ncbi:hypothetical protein [Labrys monachus]|uniref:Uncharacterized protein n=1 Tax=Labrys monachus TaxID=217067 RepID=A0ABU0FC62_9HYPH|nr:hypothetical protein [Labrys monachus]MDQ0392201.1 hypothetical protein [Labrys monachus]